MWQISRHSMDRSQTNLMKRLVSGFGLALVLAWFIAPALHFSHDENHDGGQHHDEASCALCQVVLHGVIDSGHALTAIAPVRLPETLSRVPQLTSRPPSVVDVRAHGPQGPPSA